MATLERMNTWDGGTREDAVGHTRFLHGFDRYMLKLQRRDDGLWKIGILLVFGSLIRHDLSKMQTPLFFLTGMVRFIGAKNTSEESQPSEKNAHVRCVRDRQVFVSRARLQRGEKRNTKGPPNGEKHHALHFGARREPARFLDAVGPRKILAEQHDRRDDEWDETGRDRVAAHRRTHNAIAHFWGEVNRVPEHHYRTQPYKWLCGQLLRKRRKLPWARGGWQKCSPFFRQEVGFFFTSCVWRFHRDWKGKRKSGSGGRLARSVGRRVRQEKREGRKK